MGVRAAPAARPPRWANQPTSWSPLRNADPTCSRIQNPIAYMAGTWSGRRPKYSPDLHPRIEDQIRRDDAGDRPGGADQRRRRERVHQAMRQAGGDPAEEEEDGEAGMAHAILDVVAEDPEE